MNDINKNHFSIQSPIFIIVITVLLLAPFSNKAFNFDDPLFIWSAEQIQKHPLDFYGFSANWYGIEMPMFEINQNPPLICYYIALIASLFGFHEIALHIGFLLPCCTAAVGIFYLARHFKVNPLFSSLCSILSPVFLVSSTTLMCDVTMLAFWVWSIYCWLSGLKNDSKGSLLLSSVLISLCLLTKYFGIALIPLLLFYSIAEKKKFRSYIFYLLIPVLVILFFQWYTFRIYGQGLILQAASYSSQAGSAKTINVLFKLFIGLSFMGGCLLPFLFLSFSVWSRRIIIASILGIAGLLFLFSRFNRINQTVIQTNQGTRWLLLVCFSIFIVGGISILALMILEFQKTKNSQTLLLVLWIIGTLIFTCFVNWTVSARNLLPMIPAVSILVTMRLERLCQYVNRRHFILLLISGVTALAIVWADYSLARAAKTAAAYMHEKFNRPDRKIWFQGHWGFQYYMQQAGCVPLDYNGSSTHPGDLIIIPVNNTNTQPPNQQFIRFYRAQLFRLHSPFTLMNKDADAGFYSSHWGIVPFLPTPAPDEVYLIYVVTPLNQTPKDG